MNTADKNTATLTIDKASALAVQDVTIHDQGFEVVTKGTLTYDEASLTKTLAPGRYLVTGMAPSGRSTEIRVDLRDGESKHIQLDATTGSPHEWLADAAERQELPVSDIRATQDTSERFFEVDALKRPGKHTSITLGLESVVDRSADFATATAGMNPASSLAYKVPRSGGRRKGATEQRRTDLRSYEWSSERSRWIRSNLVDEAYGQGSGDYLRLTFHGRPYSDGPWNTVNLLGAFRRGQPARFIALPLFAHGVRIVLTERYDQGRGSVSETSRISWRLSAVEDHVDGLLQSLSGRTYHDAEAVSRSALSFAERALQDKLKDPEAAVVAGLVLLRYQQLDQRADWVENLANWFPWSPDAQILGAWSNLLFDTGDDAAVHTKLVQAHASGPPQFAPTRKLLRDLLSTTMAANEYVRVPAKARKVLEKLWKRFGRESRRESPGGPVYSFERSYGARSSNS